MAHCDSNLAAASRPLTLRIRAELKVVPQPSSRGMRYVIKDTVAQRYWRLGAEAVFLLQSLDGKISAEELCTSFSREFPPRRLSPLQLTRYLSHWHQEGLITNDQPGQAEAVLERQRAWRRRAPLRLVSQLLAWRFRGFDPDRWLDRIVPRTCWLFTVWAALFFAILVASSVVLVLLHWPALDRELASLGASFTADQALLVLLTAGLVKILHELGHAVACKHFGGECHEIGFLLLLGAPALYCNVSDAWLLPDKRPRIVISAAGIMVELLVAGICTWLWWWTSPGLVHSLALYAMVICSVNTLLLNGNPLLQYDGYYILADLSDTPNLRALSSASVRRLLARLFLGLRIPSDIDDRGREPWLVMYGVASTVYRLLVLMAIWWFLSDTLEPYGAEFISWIVGALLLAVLIMEPAIGAAKFFRRPGWDREIPWRWVIPRNAVLAVGCLALLVVPLPASVVAPLVLEPRDGRATYVEVEGRLVWAVAEGARVSAGDAIVRLENLPLKIEVAQLTGERDVKRQNLNNLLRRQADPRAAAQIPTAQESLADVEERLEQRQRDLERLVIRAPCAGTVLPPPRKPPSKVTPDWTGTPLDRENLGCHLQSGDMVCILSEAQIMDVVAFVSEGKEDLVQSGQPVELFIDSIPEQRLVGTVEVPPTTRVIEAPEELVASGDLSVERDHHGRPRSNQPMFAARIALDSPTRSLLLAGTGRAKVTVAPRSIASRLWRSLNQTFRGP